MQNYFDASTFVVIHAPTPFGWIPLEWYSSGGWFTALLIIVGIGVNLLLLGGSTEKWWRSFGAFILLNVIAAIFASCAVIGCRADGCELAQTFGVALEWHVVTFEVFSVLFAITALLVFVDTI